MITFEEKRGRERINIKSNFTVQVFYLILNVKVNINSVIYVYKRVCLSSDVVNNYNVICS